MNRQHFVRSLLIAGLSAVSLTSVAKSDGLELQSTPTRLPVHGGAYGDFFDAFAVIDAKDDGPVKVRFTVTGPCDLAAAEVTATVKAGRGTAFVEVLPGGEPGTCVLRAEADGLGVAQLELEVEAGARPVPQPPGNGSPPPPPPQPPKPSPDADDDGIADADDNCPNKANGDQQDLDGDGWGDVCDAAPTRKRWH